MTPAILPPVFDPDHYRAANPDLAALDDAAAAAHYDANGRAEGRVASPMALRETLAAALSAAGSVLEIGPFCRPLVAGPGVEYLDILDAAQLRARAAAIGIDPAGCPPRIHHVGTLAQVDRGYDAVASAHAIEHQPDLVRHLEQVARLLPVGGRYHLVVPDQRYCFDHYRAPSTVADVLEAWEGERTVHGLARLVEHGALATHNDPARHWRGDHGSAHPPDRARRIRDAIDEHDRAQGAYVDVHAWYFTPDSFRDLMATLAAVGLSAFDATVYDTPHGRGEFCAVLERRRPARATPSRKHGLDMIVLQTADPFRYAPMLAITAPSATAFCRRHGFRYESFVGIRRGRWNWQASYNRILMLHDLLDRGYRGWALYLDADAWVHDLDFDLPGYLADKGDRAAILATSGVTGEHWDINDGVMLVNLGHPQGRALVSAWHAAFLAIPDAVLDAARDWLTDDNDQDLIQRILRTTPAIADAVLVESRDVMNSRDARFVRQHLRAQTPDFADRMRAIADEVATVMARGLGPTLPTAMSDERWRWRLAHPPVADAALVERPVPPPAPDAAGDRILAAWRHAGPGAVPAHAAAFADALDRGDRAAILADCAAIGRAGVAEGTFGGPRQHARAQDPLFAHRLALWTHDKLVSLAEAVGAIAVENPEGGAWGENPRRPAADLLAMIGDALGIDPAPPAHVGGYLGIAAGPCVVHLRIVDAIHAAWRLRMLADTIGSARIAEVGGGIGLTAFYARRMGLADYRLFDAPVMNAVQAHVLADDVVLAGEPPRAHAPAVLPVAALAACEPGSIDILLNVDTLPQMGHDTARATLATAHALGIRHLLSINQEAARAAPGGGPRQPVVRGLIAAAGFRPVSRHRHWVRAGHVEELFVRA